MKACQLIYRNALNCCTVASNKKRKTYFINLKYSSPHSHGNADRFIKDALPSAPLSALLMKQTMILVLNKIS